MSARDAASPPERPVADILAALALEVNDMAHLSDRLQALISSALVADGATNTDHLREFQAIDLLVQRLHGVAAFVEGLSHAARPEWRLDAAGARNQGVVLSDLARRLAGDVAPSDATDPSGDLQLFG